jgi:para-nitrobenzyl esterase
VDKLVAAIQPDAYFGPVHDGRTLPHDPFSMEGAALSVHIPMILGNTHDETRLTIGANDPSLFSLQWATLPARLEVYRPLFGALKTENIIALYRSWHPEYSASDVFFAITTDFQSWHGFLIASSRRAGQSGRFGAAPTWVYEFDWNSPVEAGKWGASHQMDLPFVFDNVQLAASMTGGGLEAQQLGSQMAEALIAFAATGDPNNAAIPKWSRFDLAQRATMCWDKISQVKSDPRSDERKLIAPVPYVQPGT